jgi:hypothetical protein
MYQMTTAIASASTTKSPVCRGSADFIRSIIEPAKADAAVAALASLDGADADADAFESSAVA